MKVNKVILFILTSILLTSNYSFQISQPQVENKMKAAFIYLFLDYIDWDSQRGEAMNIVILGRSGVYRPLLELSKKKRGSKVINVRSVNSIHEIKKSQVVFVSRQYKHSIESAISRLDPTQTLIISEEKGDLDRGSHINFVFADNKLQFEVNLRKVSGPGFKIRSQLLQHALLRKR